MTVQHVRKLRRKCSAYRMADEQMRGRPSTSAELAPAIEEVVRANRSVLLKILKKSLIVHMAQSGTLYTNV
jgi:hypothetical protein